MKQKNSRLIKETTKEGKSRVKVTWENVSDSEQAHSKHASHAITKCNIVRGLVVVRLGLNVRSE